MWAHVWTAPTAVFTPAVVAVIFLAAPQSKDLLLDLREHIGPWMGPLALGLSTAALGLSGWYWTSAILQVEHRGDVERIERHEKPCGRYATDADLLGRRWAARLPLIAALLPLLASNISAARSFLVQPFGAVKGTGTINASSDVLIIDLLVALLLAVLTIIALVRRRAGLDAYYDRHRGRLYPPPPRTRYERLFAVFAPQIESPERPNWTAPGAWSRLLLYVPAVLASGPLGIWVSGISFIVPTAVAVWFADRPLLEVPAAIAGVLSLAVLIPWLALATGVIARAGFLPLTVVLLLLWSQGGARLGYDGLPPLVRLLVAGVLAYALFWVLIRWKWFCYRIEAVWPGRRTTALVTTAVLLFAMTPPRGMYDIPTEAGLSDRRPDLDAALSTWQATCPATPSGDRPLIIVAAEGGASLSAVWTMSVMARLDKQTGGRFHRALFGISGVSGGALGAATYRELAYRYEWNCRMDAALYPGADSAKRLADKDLLSPSIRAHFLTDPLHRMFGALPEAFWAYFHVVNRADAMAGGFEKAWNEIGPEPNRVGLEERWTRPMFTEGRPTWPHLFLAGTDVRLGRRVMTSTIRFDDPYNGVKNDNNEKTSVFAGTDDLIALLCADVPLSAAVMNAARFPIISPTGQFRDGETCQQSGAAATVRDIVDGGYFDNYGVTAALELARAIHKKAPKLVPIVVVISDDANIDGDKLADFVPYCSGAGARQESPDARHSKLARAAGVGNQTLSPLMGLYNLRSGHADIAFRRLQEEFCIDKTNLFHFPLRRPREGESAPLNWVLDGPAKALLTNDWPADDFNSQQAKLLNARLAEFEPPKAEANNNPNSGESK